MKTPAELQRQRLLVYIVPSGPCLYIYDKKQISGNRQPGL